MTTNPFVDFHTHPSLKPYGKSFKKNSAGENSANRKQKNSIWFYDSPNLLERAIQMLTGISKFTQADCTTLSYGNARIICASLYPIERGFFNNDLGTGFFSDLANNFITSVGRERVNYIQNIKDYYEDLVREYEFYLQLNGKFIEIDRKQYRYILVTSYEEIERNMNSFPEDESTVYIILTIEGMHVLHSEYREQESPDPSKIMKNLKHLKQWPHPPFFVTLAHHFFNHLCGHALSLTGLVGNKTDQRVGLNEPFTELGKDVVRELLNNANGKRIYVDVKHMSAIAREQYYHMLNVEFINEKIPLIVSHGAANGLRSAGDPVVDGKDTAAKLLASDINFYDEEIVAIAKTKGIFGIQLDERRIASDATLKSTKHAIPINKIRHYRAELLWNQLQHIAELLDRHNLFAWDCIAIGSDFDGIVNPLNGFLTAETFPHLQEYIERYVHNYMEGPGKVKLKQFNQISPSEIVNRLFSLNAIDFLKRWYK